MKHSVTRNKTARVVSERVRAIMDKHGWTISDVARAGKTARSNVNFAYHGQGVPNGTVLVVLAKALRCSVAYLLGEDVPEQVEPTEPASDDQLAEWIESFRVVDQERIATLESELKREQTRVDAIVKERCHTLREANNALEGHMADAKRVVDKVNVELKNVRAHYVSMESRAAAAEAKLRAAEGDVSLKLGVVDELKADKRSLIEKVDTIGRNLQALEHRYFALAEAAEKAVETPTWSSQLRGYVISSDKMAALRKALNKAPLPGYIRAAPGESVTPTVIAFPDGTPVQVAEEAKNGNGVA